MPCPLDTTCNRYPCRKPGVALEDDPEGGCDRCVLGDCPQDAVDADWPCPCRWAVAAKEKTERPRQMGLW